MATAVCPHLAAGLLQLQRQAPATQLIDLPAGTQPALHQVPESKWHVLLPCLISKPWHLQEKQIRGKHAVKQLRDRMKANQLQVADRVRKHVASARLLPKVVSVTCRQSWALRSSRHSEGRTACSGSCTAAACSLGECPLAAALHEYQRELASYPRRPWLKCETAAWAFLQACVHRSPNLICRTCRGRSKLAIRLEQLVDTFGLAVT